MTRAWPDRDAVPYLRVRLALVLIVPLLAVVGVVSSRALFADGAYFLLQMVAKGRFVLIRNREIACLITQVLPLAAIRLGVTSVHVLSILQSLGLIVPVLALWIYALLRHLRGRLFFPLLVLFCWIYLATGFFSIGEYNLGYAAIAASASVLCLGTIRKADALLLCLVSIGLLRMYELMAFAGPLLALACLIRRWRDASSLQECAGVLLLLSAGCFLLGSGFAILSILNPRDPVVFAGSIHDLIHGFSPPVGYLTLMTLLALAASSDAVSSMARRLILATATGLTLVFLAKPNLWVAPALSYQLRTFMVLPMLMGLGLMVALLIAPHHRRWSVISAKPAAVATICLLVLALSTTQIADSLRFQGWLQTYRSELMRLRASTTIDQTRLWRDPGLRRYVWGWNNVIMSRLLGDGRLFIANRQQPGDWEPNLAPLLSSPRLQSFTW